MAEEHTPTVGTDPAPVATISRREFIQGAVVASAAVTVGALPVSTTAQGSAASVTTVLTADQSAVLTLVLDRLVPGDSAMPPAGQLGIAEFIDRALAAAPHLRRHVVGLLSKLPDEESVRQLSGPELDDYLHRLEQSDAESFDILVQATYTGYYGHPKVLTVLGWNDPSEPGHELAPFDVALLEDVRKRVSNRSDV